MSRVAVVTGIYGGHDVIRQDQSRLHPSVKYLFYTDDPSLHVPGWESVLDTDRSFLHPRLAAKWPKFMQDPMLRSFDAVVWIDGSFVILDPNFPIMVLGYASGGMAQFLHPPASGGRDCIYDEAVACRLMPKYRDTQMLRQVEHYRAAGHPPHWGMWATGVIAWGDVELAGKLGAEWWAENCDWSYHDQLSEPVVLRRNGVRPTTIPGDIFYQSTIRWTDHKTQL